MRTLTLVGEIGQLQFSKKGHLYSYQFLQPTGNIPQVDKINIGFRAVKEWQRPNDVTDVPSFLGFASFYRCYIYKFAKISVPFTQLTKK